MHTDPERTRNVAAPAPSAGEVMGVGLQFAASILIFLFVGRWLDSRLGTAPWLLMLGVFFGAAGGFFSIYRRLVIEPRERAKRNRDRES